MQQAVGSIVGRRRVAKNDTVPIGSLVFQVICRHCGQGEHEQPEPTEGVIRFRCITCKGEAIVLKDKEPTWAELSAAPLLCHCHGCNDTRQAETFAKCKTCRNEAEVVQECAVCTDHKQKLGDEFWSSSLCGHTFCRVCWKTHLEIQIQQDRLFYNKTKNYYTLPCMAAQCSLGCGSPEDIRNLVSTEAFSAFNKKASVQTIHMELNGVVCPLANCGAVFIPPPNTNMTSLRCYSCEQRFCKECRSPAHPNISCTENQERLDPALQQLLARTTKRCPNPKCGVRIEKNQGCMHMTCGVCHMEFCWLCLIPWGTGCQRAHWFG
jgi:hypothetical protein